MEITVTPVSVAAAARPAEKARAVAMKRRRWRAVIAPESSVLLRKLIHGRRNSHMPGWMPALWTQQARLSFKKKAVKSFLCPH